MDWKNSHFERSAIFQAPPEIVLEIARAVVRASLRRVESTSDGFEASGRSARHAATAKVHVGAADGGTKVDVELVVERRGAHGFMLFDIGGYYDGQVRKWFWAIWNRLAEAHLATPWEGGHSPQPPTHAVDPSTPIGARVAWVDGDGHPHVGLVREVSTTQGVRIMLDAGGERWVPAPDAHVL